MIPLSRVTAQGQTTIPHAVRRALGLRPGDMVAYEPLADGRFVIRKAKVVMTDARTSGAR